MDKITPLGNRFLAAFAEELGLTDKLEIAQKLGFKSEQSIYKIISGQRELDFEKLQKFQNYTKRSIYWLLTGEDDELSNSKNLDLGEVLETKITELILKVLNFLKFGNSGNQISAFENKLREIIRQEIEIDKSAVEVKFEQREMIESPNHRVLSDDAEIREEKKLTRKAK